MDNIPVFPIRDLNEHPGPMGLTIRDYFAGQAMVGLVTFENGERLKKLFGDRDVPDKASPEEYFAKVAYWLADAMLKARG